MKTDEVIKILDEENVDYDIFYNDIRMINLIKSGKMMFVFDLNEELKEVLFNNGCIYPKNMRVSPETKEYCCIEFYDDEKTYGRIYLKRKNGHHVL